MKTRRFLRSRLASASFLALSVSLGSLSAGILYWDTDGATAGSDTTVNAIWGATDAWTTDSTGSIATSAYVSGSDVILSAGTNATGAYTFKVTGNQIANSLTFEEGTVTISSTDALGNFSPGSGSITLGAGGLTMADGLNGDVLIGSSTGNVTLSSSQAWTNSTTTTPFKLTVAAGVIGTATTGNTQTLNSSGSTELQGVIDNGSGGGALALTKSGSGTLTLSGGSANTYTGLTTISGGTLALAKSTSTASIAGNILVSGGALTLTNANQIADSSAVTITSGSMTFNGKSETFASLDITGGSFSTGNGGGTTAASTNIITGAVTSSGKITVNSGSAFSVGSLAMSGGNNAITSSGSGNILMGGNHDDRVTTFDIGSGGLSMTGQTIQVNGNGSSGAEGARITLGGNFTGTNTNLIGIYSNGGALTPVNELALGTGTRAFDVTGTTTIGLNTTGENISKSGSGTLVFSNDNTFTGTVATTGGTLDLRGANTYTGTTTVGAGSRIVVRHNNALGTTAGGTNVSDNASVVLVNDVTVTGEALSLTGTSSGSTYAYGLSNSSGNNEWAGTVNINLAPNNGRFYSTDGNLTVSGQVTFSSATAGTAQGNYLVLGGGSTGNGVISGDIVQGVGTTQKLGIIKNTSDTWTLSGNNSHKGATLIYDGTLSVSSIASNLGTDTSAIGLGNGTTTGRLRYTGTGETATRNFNLGGTVSSGNVGSGTIEQAGTGLLKINGNVTSSTTSLGKTLTLTGSTAGTGEIAGNISNGTGAPTSLVKSGTGTWTISGSAKSYSGSTSVTGGQLIAIGAINATTSLGITNGTFTLGASNIVNNAATVSLGTGANLQMAGFTETFAALTVTGSDAILDLSGGNSLVNFADSSSADWTGGLLTITGWSGLLTGGGSEQVAFASAGLTTGQVSQVRFLNPTGLAAGTYSSQFIGNEIVPNMLIPEPSALLLTALGSLALLRRKRRA